MNDCILTRHCYIVAVFLNPSCIVAVSNHMEYIQIISLAPYTLMSIAVAVIVALQLFLDCEYITSQYVF